MPRLIRRIGRAPPPLPISEPAKFPYYLERGFRLFCGDTDNREVYVISGHRVDDNGNAIPNTHFICPYNLDSGGVQHGYGELDSLYAGNYPLTLPLIVLNLCGQLLGRQPERHVVPINWPPTPEDLQPAAPERAHIGQLEEYPSETPLPSQAVICTGCGTLDHSEAIHRRCCPDCSYQSVFSAEGRLAVREFRRLREIRRDVCLACDYRMDSDLGRVCQQNVDDPHGLSHCRYHSARIYQTEPRRAR